MPHLDTNVHSLNDWKTPHTQSIIEDRYWAKERSINTGREKCRPIWLTLKMRISRYFMRGNSIFENYSINFNFHSYVTLFEDNFLPEGTISYMGQFLPLFKPPTLVSQKDPFSPHSLLINDFFADSPKPVHSYTADVTLHNFHH